LKLGFTVEIYSFSWAAAITYKKMGRYSEGSIAENLMLAVAIKATHTVIQMVA